MGLAVREGIHPKYVDAVIRCACGNTVKTRATKADIQVEVCSQCHPFYTGTQKILDTAGRIERYRRKYGMEKKSAARG